MQRLFCEELDIIHVSYSLSSLKGVLYRGLYRGSIKYIKGDTRSLDYSSLNPKPLMSQAPRPKFQGKPQTLNRQHLKVGLHPTPATGLIRAFEV